MDTTVKESVELMVELICAFSVMAMLSLAMYTDVISRLLERLFLWKMQSESAYPSGLRF